MGHNFGMSHDFDDKHCKDTTKTYDEYGNKVCVMGNGPDNCKCNGQGIMSYGDFPSKWSSCSVEDFIGYYNSKKWGNTCLKGNIIYLLNYISMDFNTQIFIKVDYSTFQFYSRLAKVCCPLRRQVPRLRNETANLLR